MIVYYNFNASYTQLTFENEDILIESMAFTNVKIQCQYVNYFVL